MHRVISVYQALYGHTATGQTVRKHGFCILKPSLFEWKCTNGHLNNW